jgi:hypothetical protein
LAVATVNSPEKTVPIPKRIINTKRKVINPAMDALLAVPPSCSAVTVVPLGSCGDGPGFAAVEFGFPTSYTLLAHQPPHFSLGLPEQPRLQLDSGSRPYLP